MILVGVSRKPEKRYGKLSNSVDVCHIKLTPGTTGREQNSLAVIFKTYYHPVNILSGILLPTHNTRFIPTTKCLQAEIKSEI